MKRAAYVLMALALAAAAAVVAGCGARIQGLPSTVATVNGQAISAEDYLDQLHRVYGQQALSGMIQQQLVVQWANDEKVPVTDQQIQKQISALKRDGQYEDYVKEAGQEGLARQLRYEQAMANLGRKFYKVNKKDLEDAYESSKATYVHGPRKRIALILLDDKKAIQEAARKIKGGGEFDDVAAEYRPPTFFGAGGAIKVWLDVKQDGLPKPLVEAVKNTKVGEVSKAIEMNAQGGGSQYAILQVLQEQGKANLKLKDVALELEKAVAMRKMSEQNQDWQQRFYERKKKAKVDVEVKAFEGSITAQLHTRPATAPMMQPGPAPAPAPEAEPEGEAEAE